MTDFTSPRPRTASLILLLGLLSLLFAPSCSRHSGQTSTSSQADSLTQAEIEDFARDVSFVHAQGISVENHPDYKLLTLYQSEEHKPIARYALYHRSKSRPDVTADAYIAVPASRLACLSTSQVGALPLLQAVDRLVGVSDLDLLNGEDILSRVQQGHIQVIGKGMSKDYERIVALRPDILLTSFLSDDSQEAELAKAGIHVLLDNEWKEQTLLGRAEWIKFIALLLGKNKVAEEHFQQIEADYLAALKLTQDTSQPLPVLYGLDYQGAWYLPGELSYLADLLHSAGLQPEVTPQVVTGLPVTLEHILSKHRNDSIWICMPPSDIHSIRELITLNPRYADLRATQSGQVLVPNKRINATGGNDYWQTGVYEPNIQVKDLIALTRPELLPNYTPRYWLQLPR